MNWGCELSCGVQRSSGAFRWHRKSVAVALTVKRAPVAAYGRKKLEQKAAKLASYNTLAKASFAALRRLRGAHESFWLPKISPGSPDNRLHQLVRSIYTPADAHLLRSSQETKHELPPRTHAVKT